MILIADSGTTKVEWRVIYDDSSVAKITTSGINPVYMSPPQIIEMLWRELVANITYSPKFSDNKIFFYGAGIIDGDMKTTLSESLTKVFPQADIFAGSDMVAAARALYIDKAGIACILGTGSNSCFYDGRRIVDNVRSGGFILGDEGSGAHMGRMLLADFVKRRLPENIYNAFKERYNLDYSIIVQKVYRESFPSRFLASFSPFIRENWDDEYIHNIIVSSIDSFLERNIQQYDYRHYPISFVGSVADTFKSILTERSKAKGMTVYNILPSPCDNLVKYHLKYL